jgi:TonB family protein
MTKPSCLRGLLLILVLVVLPVRTSARAGEETLASAREMYSAAAYDEALIVLNRLRPTASGDDALSIDQYRAFCLLALGRSQDAVQAIEAVVTAQPMYMPSESEVSPRVRSAFTEVRRRLLPTLIERRYASAKDAFDRKDFVPAAAGFKQVLDALGDPDVALASGKPPLSDIRTLSAGFFDLSTAAAAVVAATPLPPPPPVVPLPAPTVAVTPPVRQAPKIYVVDEPGVTPPVAVKQMLPEFTKPGGPLAARMMQPPEKGMIEIVIDERGNVESAMMRVPVHKDYDAEVLQAARGWKYKPAVKDGAPVKFRKYITISVKL